MCMLLLHPALFCAECGPKSLQLVLGRFQAAISAVNDENMIAHSVTCIVWVGLGWIKCYMCMYTHEW